MGWIVAALFIGKALFFDSSSLAWLVRAELVLGSAALALVTSYGGGFDVAELAARAPRERVKPKGN